MTSLRSLDDLHDFLGYVVLRAPDRFLMKDDTLSEMTMALEEAFQKLRAGLDFVDDNMVGADMKEKLYVLLEAAHAAYAAGDRSRGANFLQDLESIVFSQ